MSFNTNLPSGNARYGELRVDPTDLLTYRYVVGGWILEGSATPSSASFPAGKKAGEIREDIMSGGKYRWSGSAWVLQTKLGDDKNQNLVVDESDDSTAIGGVTVTGTPSVDQIIIATSPTEATWQDLPATGAPLTATVTLTPAQVKALYTTPITLLAAQGGGKTIIPHRISAKLDYKTVPYATGNQISIAYENDTTVPLISIPGLLPLADFASLEVLPTAYAIAKPNMGMVITSPGSNPSVGDSPVIVTVEYEVLDIATTPPPVISGFAFSGTVPDGVTAYTNLKIGGYRTGHGYTAAPLFTKATGVTVTAASGGISAVTVNVDGYIHFNYTPLAVGFDLITLNCTDEYGRAVSLTLNNEIIY